MGFLSPQEERELARAWREDGDIRARERLVMSHVHLCRRMAWRFDRSGAKIDDLLQEGIIALMTAADLFDPDKGARFSTYSSWWVRASMQDFIASGGGSTFGMTGASRKISVMLPRARAVATSMLQSERSEPSEAAIIRKTAELLSMREETVRDYMAARNSISLNLPVSSDREGSSELMDFLPGAGMDGEASCIARDTETFLSSAIEKLLAGLEDREAEVIRRRLLMDDDRDTLADIASDMNISRERVRQIQVKALEKMRKKARRDRLSADMEQALRDMEDG